MITCIFTVTPAAHLNRMQSCHYILLRSYDDLQKYREDHMKHVIGS